ncbi:Coenzyme PQQ synthesis protein A [Rhodobacter sp. AKP1]|nr:Coenzyme PQQ synthesis protein A [Rhodobacter sp. AKP1]
MPPAPPSALGASPGADKLLPQHGFRCAAAIGGAYPLHSWRPFDAAPIVEGAAPERRHHGGGDPMAWKTPRYDETPVGMEINMYSCAKRK